jgi:Ser/Thr protein kinase RdoA (MazF antagonist)
MFGRPPRGFSRTRAETGVERAIAFARGQGLAAERGEIISESANLLVRLEPGPHLARMSHLIDLVRADGELPWYQHEVAVTRFLAEAGETVPRPIGDPVRDEDGVSLCLWEWLEHDPRPQTTDRELGQALRRLHRALAGYQGELPSTAEVLGEIDVLAGSLMDDDDEMLRAAGAALPQRRAELVAAIDDVWDGRSQALHGDAHAANVVAVDSQLVWIDFEDTQRGPVEYDLATTVGNARVHGGMDEQEFLAGYGGGWNPELVELMIQARRLQVICWCALYLTEQPDLAYERKRVADWVDRFG